MTIEGWTIQDIQLELIKRSSFNDFDGEMVEASLAGNQGLWQGVIMDRAGYPPYDARKNEHIFAECIDLIKLRDIKDNIWNVSTLYILTTPGKEALIEKLVGTWGADEVDWIDEKAVSRMLGGPIYPLLRVWWD